MNNISIGDNAPNFTLKVSNDKDLKLSDFKGKYLILYFYPKDDTPGCTLEAKDFQSLQEEFAALNAEIIGVSKDSLASHDKFCNKYGLTFHLGSDFEGDTCEKYGVWGEKSMFGKKYMGINRATFLIDTEGKVAFIWPSVSPMNHAREVLTKLKELQA